jgi:hypothetical protein
MGWNYLVTERFDEEREGVCRVWCAMDGKKMMWCGGGM